MIKYDDIGDEEIRIVTENNNKTETGKPHSMRWATVVAAIILLMAAGWYFFLRDARPDEVPADDAEPGYFELLEEQQDLSMVDYDQLFGDSHEDDGPAFCETMDTLVDTVTLRLYHPIHATASLYVGNLSELDPDDIVFATQAADIRADNGKIVGAFVQDGHPLAWGLSKKGFCAIISNVFTIGMSDDTPLFTDAISCGGHFFRQYALVTDGKPISNAPANITTRRGLCERHGDIFIAESITPTSMNTFAETLAQLGVSNAIYLVGSNSWGWYADRENVRHEFGQRSRRLPRYTNYIMWTKGDR